MNNQWGIVEGGADRLKSGRLWPVVDRRGDDRPRCRSVANGALLTQHGSGMDQTLSTLRPDRHLVAQLLQGVAAG